jgi:hypothetical protein
MAENRILLKNVRQSYMTYWTPEAFPDSPDPTKYYSGTYILAPTHPQFKTLNKMIDGIGLAKWEKKWPATKKLIEAKGKVFFRDGDTKPDVDGFAGNWFVSARSKVRPNYFGMDKMPLTEDMGVLYSGCYVNVSLECYAYTKGSLGIGARIRGVQFCGKGDAFGGGGPPADDSEFEEIENPESDEDEEETSSSLMD